METLVLFFRRGILLALLAALAAHATLSAAEPARTLPDAPARAEVLLLDNGTAKVGIDRAKGAAITWLSWTDYPKNTVNSSDPGRLIQQSYYAGKRLDRKADGQSKSWSPWTWNPIQGGGVSSWARVNDFKRLDDHTLYAETVPKLWDMPNEEAAALMRQWTGFEPEMPNVIVVRCELISQRPDNDRWGPAVPCPQEIPACYFTRNFSVVKSYLGAGQWRAESQPPGPPWGKARPPRKAMAFFAANGQGVALFSPAATQNWNFGPHAGGASDDPAAGPCMHMAPIDRVSLAPKSTYRYRYWLVVGNETQLAERLNVLWEKYSAEHAELLSQMPEKVTDKELRLTPGDLKAMARLGNYYAENISGATNFALFDRTGKAELKESAVKHLQEALAHWNAYAAAATSQYRPQLLTCIGYVDLNALTEKVRQDVEMASEWKPQKP